MTGTGRRSDYDLWPWTQCLQPETHLHCFQGVTPGWRLEHTAWPAVLSWLGCFGAKFGIETWAFSQAARTTGLSTWAAGGQTLPKHIPLLSNDNLFDYQDATLFLTSFLDSQELLQTSAASEIFSIAKQYQTLSSSQLLEPKLWQNKINFPKSFENFHHTRKCCWWYTRAFQTATSPSSVVVNTPGRESGGSWFETCSRAW